MKRILPTEIHLQVLTYVNKKTLLEYQLVCRNWNLPARHLLYQNVRIRNYSQFRKFAKTVAAYPYLGNLVVTLDVSDLRFTSLDSQDDSLSGNNATFNLLIHHTPNMRSFCSNVGIPGSLYIAIATARYQGHWTHLCCITDPKWYNDHTDYFTALVAFRQSLTELKIPIILGHGPMSFEEWLFDSTKINFINLRKICCYTGGTVSIETIDKIIDGFPQLKSVHLKLCQVFYHPIQSINPKPEIAIQTLCIDIEHLTDTLILYICKRFPNVDSFTLCTSTPSVSIGPFLSKVAIDAFVSYLRSVNKFNVSFGLLENQRQLVSALSKAHWQGKRKVLLTLNDDEGCLLRRIKIQAEQFSSTGQYRTIRIKNATCLKPRLQDWIGYMSQIDRLELGDHKTKTLRDISGYLDELVLYSKQIKVLTLSNCLINCFNSTFSQASLTYLSLEDCVCSLEGYQTISRAFPNLKHISIIQSRLQNRHVIISMPFSSVDTFKFESDPLWHLDHFYLQVSTKSRFARYRHTNRHMNFYPRYQKATVLKVQVFLKQIKHLSVSLYKSNIILDHQQEIKNTS